MSRKVTWTFVFLCFESHNYLAHEIGLWDWERRLLLQSITLSFVCPQSKLLNSVISGEGVICLVTPLNPPRPRSLPMSVDDDVENHDWTSNVLGRPTSKSTKRWLPKLWVGP